MKDGWFFCFCLFHRGLPFVLVCVFFVVSFLLLFCSFIQFLFVVFPCCLFFRIPVIYASLVTLPLCFISQFPFGAAGNLSCLAITFISNARAFTFRCEVLVVRWYVMALGMSRPSLRDGGVNAFQYLQSVTLTSCRPA